MGKLDTLKAEPHVFLPSDETLPPGLQATCLEYALRVANAVEDLLAGLEVRTGSMELAPHYHALKALRNCSAGHHSHGFGVTNSLIF